MNELLAINVYYVRSFVCANAIAIIANKCVGSTEQSNERKRRIALIINQVLNTKFNIYFLVLSDVKQMRQHLR